MKIYDFKSQKLSFFDSLIESRGWSDKKFVLWKSAIFHSINLPFDEQFAEKILNVI